MLRFFRALSIFFRYILRPRYRPRASSILTESGWDSEGAAVCTALRILKRNCRKAEPLQGSSAKLSFLDFPVATRLQGPVLDFEVLRATRVAREASGERPAARCAPGRVFR